MSSLSADELARLAIDGNVRALRELNRRHAEGDAEAKRAGDQVVLAKRRGSPGARRVIDVCNRQAVRRLNRSWEAGRLPGIERDVGHGFEAHADWLTRRRSTGRAPRPATNTRTRGSRRGTRQATGTGSRAGPDDPDPESDPHRLSPLLLGRAGR